METGKSNTKLLFDYKLIIIILLCFLSRLPVLLTNNFLLDGDECITGLMAKHFSEGNGFPWFFYGQSYGFSFIEVVFISIFYLFFGISDLAVKLSMLALWTIGIIFFYKSLKTIKPNEKWLPFIFAILFITSPSWFIWSMKARGGYITAFTLFSICTFMLLNIKEKTNYVYLIITGCLFVIIFQSQPLWLLGLFPVAFYHYYKTSIKQTAIIVSGIIISSILFYFIKHDIREFWLGPEIDIMNFHFDTILTFPEKLFHHLTGSYYYNEIMQYSIFTMLWSVLFEVLIVGLIITAFVRIIAKKHYLLFYIFTVSVILTIGFLFIENEETPRYLLPLTGCVLYMFYSFSIISNYKIIIYILTGSLIILGSIAIFYTNNDCKIADRKNIIHLTDELQSNNIHNVYCKDGLLQWQIMFYSNEKVIARYTGSSDRYPEYIKTVDKGREKDCDNTAIVGYYYPEIKQQYEDVIILDEKFYIFKSPGKGLLIDQGFEMTEN